MNNAPDSAPDAAPDSAIDIEFTKPVLMSDEDFEALERFGQRGDFVRTGFETGGNVSDPAFQPLEGDGADRGRIQSI